jgi:RNA polymerase sigma factor (sigma-70 family)
MRTELTDLVRSGELAHYGKLFELHRTSAGRLARRYTYDNSNADELISRAFEKILMALINGSGPDDANFSSYLYIVIRNEAASLARCEKRQRTLAEALGGLPSDWDHWERAVSEANDSLLSVAAIHAYNRLPARYRIVLQMTAIDHQGKSAACEALNLKPNTVDALAYRARKKLRQNFAEERRKVNSVPDLAQRNERDLSRWNRQRIRKEEERVSVESGTFRRRSRAC